MTDMVAPGCGYVPTPALAKCGIVLEEYATFRSLQPSQPGDLPGPNLGPMVELMSCCNIPVASFS